MPLILTSCANDAPPPRTEISPVLYAPTPAPAKPVWPYEQDAVAEYLLGHKRALEQCNLDKATIGEILKK